MIDEKRKKKYAKVLATFISKDPLMGDRYTKPYIAEGKVVASDNSIVFIMPEYPDSSFGRFADVAKGVYPVKQTLNRKFTVSDLNLLVEVNNCVTFEA